MTPWAASRWAGWSSSTASSAGCSSVWSGCRAQARTTGRGGGDPLTGALAAAERLFAEKGGQLAALVMEPLVQGAAGMWMHPPGFLSAMAELCRRHDVLLICDEVATGFGRTGTLFAVEQEGVPARLPLPGQGTVRRLPAAGGDADHRAGLRGVPRGVRLGADLLPRPHLHREPPGLCRGAGLAAALRDRGRAGAGASHRGGAGPRAGGAGRAAPRGRRSPARPDGGRGAGARPEGAGALRLRRARSDIGFASRCASGASSSGRSGRWW